MNPFEVGNLEPHERQRQKTGGPRKLFWTLMVIISARIVLYGFLGLLLLLVLKYWMFD